MYEEKYNGFDALLGLPRETILAHCKPAEIYPHVMLVKKEDSGTLVIRFGRDDAARWLHIDYDKSV